MINKIWIDHLKSAIQHRPLGYYEEVTRNGRIENGVLFIDSEIYASLCRKYSKIKRTSITNHAKGLAKSMIVAAKNPTPASKEEQERRLSICNSCEFLKDGKRCIKCGCIVNWKTRLAAWHCPIDKW